LLIGFGGPASPGEVRPFLRAVARGRNIPEARLEEVAHHYELAGGYSPYNETVLRQAAALRETLARSGLRVPVHVGMRNWPPLLGEALEQLARNDVRRVVGFVLAPHRCEASFERYVASVNAARKELGERAPEVEYTGGWHDHPLFIEAVAAQVQHAMEKLPEAERAGAHLLFSAHSIPQAMAAGSTYADEFKMSASMVAAALKRTSWSLAYQSRSGDPREPWLEPKIEHAIESLAGSAVIVVPVGFVCENVELLYDLDIEIAALARSRGVTMVRARAVNDDPRFVEMMAAMISARLDGAAGPATS
jgi:ferrochelatase